MARKAHTGATAGRAGRTAVDPAVFDGLDLHAIKQRAEELRVIGEKFGKSVMRAVAAGIPLERARKLGSTHRPTSDR